MNMVCKFYVNMFSLLLIILFLEVEFLNHMIIQCKNFWSPFSKWLCHLIPISRTPTSSVPITPYILVNTCLCHFHFSIYKSQWSSIYCDFHLDFPNDNDIEYLFQAHWPFVCLLLKNFKSFALFLVGWFLSFFFCLFAGSNNCKKMLRTIELCWRKRTFSSLFFAIVYVTSQHHGCSGLPFYPHPKHLIYCWFGRVEVNASDNNSISFFFFNNSISNSGHSVFWIWNGS